jgi:hypothetical protein
MTSRERILKPVLFHGALVAFGCFVIWEGTGEFLCLNNEPWTRVVMFASTFLNAFIAAINIYTGAAQVHYRLRFRKHKSATRKSFIEQYGPEEGERRYREFEFEREGENG